MLRPRWIFSLIAIFIGILILGWLYSKSQSANTALSQPPLGLTEAYHSTDGSLTFKYPTGWIAANLDNGSIDLENMPEDKRVDNVDAVRLEITAPEDVAELSMTGQGTTPSVLVEQSLTVGGQAAALFSQGLSSGASGNSSTMSPSDGSVNNFTVNGLPAAWGRQTTSVLNVQASSMIIFVDVGNNHIIDVFATPYNAGGTTLLDRYQNTILAIVDTIRYSPPPTPTVSSTVNSTVSSTVSASAMVLSKTFTGTAGVWELGNITFNYPGDWNVISLGPVIQNTSAQLNQQNLQSGQMQAAVIDPGSNMALLKDFQDVTNCRANPAGVTAMAVVQKQIPTTPEDKQRTTAAGLTYSTPEATKIGGKDAVLLRLHQNKTEVLLIDIDLGNGNIAGLMAFTPDGEMQRYESTLKAIVGTFSYKPKAGCTPPTAMSLVDLGATATAGQLLVTPLPQPLAITATAVPSQTIVFVSATDKESWQLWAQDTNGEHLRQLTHLGGLYGGLSWSPDGSHIAFTLFPNSAFSGLSLYVMKPDGSDVRVLSKNASGSLSWSPNSRTIAFISQQAGNRQLFTIDSDGSNLRQITQGSSEVYSATWSPDSRYIMFNRDNYNLYVIDAQSLSEQQITSTGQDEDPAWSPDGRLVAFSSGRLRNKNLGELFIMNADGSNARPLTTNLNIPNSTTSAIAPEDNWYAIESIDWSPDSHHIAFTTKRNGVIDAFVIDPDGTNLRHIASNDSGLSWSPDSHHIVYGSGPLNKQQLFVANADGSNGYPLSNVGPFDNEPIWSPTIPNP